MCLKFFDLEQKLSMNEKIRSPQGLDKFEWMGLNEYHWYPLYILSPSFGINSYFKKEI